MPSQTSARPSPNLIEIIRMELIGSLARSEMNILAMPHEGKKLPAGVEITHKAIKGPRVPVKNRRPASQMSVITALWPEDGLCSRNEAFLTFITAGKLKMQVGAQVVRCEKGTVIFIPPNMPHPTGSDPQSLDGYASFLWIRRCGRGMRCWQTHLHDGKIWHSRPGESFYLLSEDAIQAFTLLCNELESHNEAAVVQPSLLLFLQLLLRNLKMGQAFHTTAYNTDREIEHWQNEEPYSPIKMACQYIQSHLADPLTLASVARVVHMSRSNFAVAFKREMNQTFLEYVQKLRLERAESFLKETDWTIQTVCVLCGFSSYPSFNNFFKQATGLTPKEYRKKYSQ